jgi:hypothetical protein
MTVDGSPVKVVLKSDGSSVGSLGGGFADCCRQDRQVDSTEKPCDVFTSLCLHTYLSNPWRGRKGPK